MKQVSMSWWLSQPVQEYLDAQLKLARNYGALDRIREWLRDRIETREAVTENSVAGSRTVPGVIPLGAGLMTEMRSRAEHGRGR